MIHQRNFMYCVAACFLVLLLTSALPRQKKGGNNPNTFRLGVTVPLSGDFASYGKEIQAGLEMAKADLDERGYQLELLYEDACLPEQALTALNKLIHFSKIDALAANFCVIAVPAMAELIEREKLLTFHTAAASDSVLDAGEYIFATNVAVRSEAIRVAEYAFNKLNAQTASVLHIETDFGVDYAKYFKLRFEELGGTVLSSIGSTVGANDFRIELTRVKKHNPDVLFAAHLGLTLGVLLKQARMLGLDQQALGVYEAEDDSVLSTAGDAAEGLKFFTPERVNMEGLAADFQRRFSDAYGRKPTILATNAYDSLTLAVKALTHCKKDRACARQYIYNLSEINGVSGDFSINQSGGTIRELQLKQVKGGKFQQELSISG